MTQKNNNQWLIKPLEILKDSPKSKHIFIFEDQNTSEHFFHQFCALSGELASNAIHLPYFSNVGVFRYESARLRVAQRISAFHRWAEQNAHFLFTNPSALFKRTQSPEWYKINQIELKTSEEIDLEAFLQKLDSWNYRKYPQVDEVGTYALRGNILDIWPPTQSDPVRLDTLGDEIHSIRSFRKANQRSFGDLKSIKVTPASEFVWHSPEDEKKVIDRFNSQLLSQRISGSARSDLLENIKHHVPFPGIEDTFVFFNQEPLLNGLEFLMSAAQKDSPKIHIWIPTGNSSSPEYFKTFDEHWRDYDKQNLLAKEKNLLSPTANLVFPHLPELPVVSLEKVAQISPLISNSNVEWEKIHPEHLAIPKGIQNYFLGKSHKLSERIQTILNCVNAKLIQSVIITSKNPDNLLELSGQFYHHIKAGFPKLFPPKSLQTLQVFEWMESNPANDPTIHFRQSSLRGFIYLPSSQSFVVSEDWLRGFEADISNSPIVTSSQSDAQITPANEQMITWMQTQMGDLNEGDLVVHVQYGIGRFMGLKTIEVMGIKGDFLEVEYKGGDRVYVTVQKMNLIQRYIGGSKHDESLLDSLKGTTWEKKKQKAKEEALKLAKEMMAHQAKRVSTPGHAFSRISDDYISFESAFPYEESPDQLKAIKEINQDMSLPKCMDRLLCGDVGFGKTEVAMRAAYRCVLDGYQVAWLVPTTVLAQQHLRSLKERFHDFGVHVELLDRGQGAQAQQILSRLKSGKIDIIIGTHRLLSKDVEFHQLGLLVVDEEQRFGVIQKERIKNISYGVDVLTLTATPIPRTLQMAMIGLRDLSLLTTPPKSRLAVRTLVCPNESDIIREAITQELARGGQVFYVHNRVEELASIKEYLQGLVPSLRICMGHGKMSEKELDVIIVDFLDSKYDLLLCTTIIESGIDMPNVNTILIQNAQNFGLAQLYQLRGRVGRRSNRGFCYFLTPDQLKETDDGYKRLQILKDNQDLGSGFIIASQDLELRGSGNILGDEQSGKVSDVGLETYSQMLDEALRSLGGIEVKAEREIEINLPVVTQIPEDYISNTKDRVRFYRRFFASKSVNEIGKMEQECIDRFGPIPQEFRSLIDTARLRVWLLKAGATSLVVGSDHTEIKFSVEVLQDTKSESTQALISRILDVCNRQIKNARLTPDGRIMFALKRKQFLDHPDQSFTDLKKLVTSIIGEKI